MKVISHGIVDGVIADRFGKHGPHCNENGVPNYSLPLEILEAPQGTQSFALLLEDKDACPVCGGFSWIHWVAANITRTKLEENDSQAHADFVQGLNSWVSIQGGSRTLFFAPATAGWRPPTSPIPMSCMFTPWIPCWT